MGGQNGLQNAWRETMAYIKRRITPPEGVETKLGDLVTYEVVLDDGTSGTISTHITEFDLNIKKD